MNHSCRWFATTGVGLVLALCHCVRADERGRATEDHDVRADCDPRAFSARIDALIDQQLREAGVPAAPLADDAEFFRRLSLDLNGRIPSVVQLRDFRDDARPGKRRLWINEFIDGSDNSPLYVNHFKNTWRRVLLGQQRAQPALIGSLEGWAARQVSAGTPYDRFVRELFTSPDADAFFAANDWKPVNLAARTSRLFLGMRLECVQCHDDRMGGPWKRTQFWQLAAFFSTPGMVGLGGSPGAQDARARAARIRIADGESWVEGAFLDGRRPDWQRAQPRALLADWLTSPENPWFARAAVNRLWREFFGAGLVEPVDGFGQDDNVASHPELLDELARELVGHRYDLKFLIRAIAGSATYQRSSRQTHPGQADPRLFARATVRALTPEQLIDSLRLATGSSFTDLAPKSGPADRSESATNKFLAEFDSAHDGGTDDSATVQQALAMMNDALMEAATNPGTSRTLAAVLRRPSRCTAQQVEELYLVALSREPTQSERDRLVRFVEAGERTHGLCDVFWAILNSTEFLQNH